MNKHQIRVWIAGHSVPFTEKSGSRPVLFNYELASFDREERVKWFKTKLRHFMNNFAFYELSHTEYKYVRNGIIDATINVFLQDRLWNESQNYIIVSIDEQFYMYYVSSYKLLQSNTFSLRLRLDVISTYFWMLNFQVPVNVDRLNYDISGNDKLLSRTLQVSDDMVKDIEKERTIISKGDSDLVIDSYNVRSLKSSFFEKPGNNQYHHFKNNELVNYQKFNTETYGLEPKSEEILYSYTYPSINDVEQNVVYVSDVNINTKILLKEGGSFVSSPIGWFIKLFINKGINKDIAYSTFQSIRIPFTLSSFKFDKFYVKTRILNNTSELNEDIEKWKSSSNVAGYLYVMWINNNSDVFVKIPQGFRYSFYHTEYNYKIDFQTTKDVSFWYTKGKFSEKDIYSNSFKFKMLKEILEPHLFTYKSEFKTKNSFSIPKIFNSIPPIKELVDFKFNSWTGDSIDIRPLKDFPLTTFNVCYQKYFSITTFEPKTYLSFLNGTSNKSDTLIENKNEIVAHIPIINRFDSKAEYLAANANQIEAQKTGAKLEVVSGFINGAISGAVAAATGTAKSIFNTVAQPINGIMSYANKMIAIQGKLDDVSNSRSSYNGGESGDSNLLSSEKHRRVFNKDGFNVSIHLPTGELYRQLKFAYYKYGCKLDSNLWLKECFEATKYKNFTYFKLNDTSNLYVGVDIPNEAIEYIDDILYNGIHFWRTYNPVFYIVDNDTYSSNITYFDVKVKNGVIQQAETKVLDI